MDALKQEIQEWLKVTGKSRTWLADQLFVDKRPVDAWLSTAGKIPPAKMAIIELLMTGENARNQPLQDLKNIPDLMQLLHNLRMGRMHLMQEQLLLLHLLRLILLHVLLLSLIHIFPSLFFSLPLMIYFSF